MGSAAACALLRALAGVPNSVHELDLARNQLDDGVVPAAVVAALGCPSLHRWTAGVLMGLGGR